MSDRIYEQEPTLTIAERDQLMQELHRDGYIVLPHKLPQWMIEEADRVTERFVDETRKFEPQQTLFDRTNVVELDPIFRRVMMFTPALQLSYDCFGPQFILAQDQYRIKYPGAGGGENRIDWHSDGPANFPEVDGRCALHTLRFGYMISDGSAPDCGGIDVIPGSHKKPVLHARRNLHWEPFQGYRDEDFSQDLVEVRGEAGTIYAFHNATWHRALPNLSDKPRKVLYFQYTPTWMRPVQRNVPSHYDIQLYTAEERWLLGEPRPGMSWMYPTAEDNKRLARFSRDA